ncbi:hypothetical protein BC940DRAFT_302650 [Gongronella butleri]|nr:hypothetical protein BC940DRAFT_302650 [Gongronella butleri]
MMMNPDLYLVILVINAVSIIAATGALCVQFMRLTRLWTEQRAIFTTIACLTISYALLAFIAMVPEPTCQIKKSLMVWMQHQTTMLTTTLALLFIQPRRFPTWICVGPIVLAGILGSASAPLNKADIDAECWFSSETALGSFALFAVPQCACLLANVSVCIYLLCTRSKKKPAADTVPTIYLLYLVLPLVLEMGPILAAMMYYATEYKDQGMAWWAWLSPGLGGMLMLVLVLVDPHLWQGILEKYNDEEYPKIVISSPHMLDDAPTSHTTLTTAAPSSASVVGAATALEEKKNEIPPPLPVLPRSVSPPPAPLTIPMSTTSLALSPDDMHELFATKTPADGSQITCTSPVSMTSASVGPLTSCYQMEDAVPWRVLEVDEDDEEQTGAEASNHENRENDDDSSAKRSTNKESWLSLDDDDDNDDDVALAARTSSESGNSSVSQWLASRRDGSMDKMGRTSKSIRRWRRQQQNVSASTSPTDTSILAVVHEEER